MTGHNNLQAAVTTRKEEFYTQLPDIEKWAYALSPPFSGQNCIL